jgi:NAD+ diphosphatase
MLYLFQGSSLLLPDEIPDSQIAPADSSDIFCGVKREMIAKNFEKRDEFEIPAVDVPGMIAGASIPEGAPIPLRWRSVPARQILSVLAEGKTVDGKGPVGALLRAFHIAQWRRDSLFCGSCGTANTDAPEELARLCPACGRLEFPRISPAVIVIITNDDDKALLAHNKKFTNGVYSLIAGFNEAGESLESTVAREIREEVNIEVSDIRYIASQPWPFPNSLMLGFTARYASGTIRPDGIEIEDAKWFSRADLPKLPGNGSVSRDLINRWIEGRAE